MSSVKGYYGKLLFIDLSSGKIEKEQFQKKTSPNSLDDEDLEQKFFGIN